jgi:hypothetical protein
LRLFLDSESFQPFAVIRQDQPQVVLRQNQ